MVSGTSYCCPQSLRKHLILVLTQRRPENHHKQALAGSLAGYLVLTVGHCVSACAARACTGSMYTRIPVSLVLYSSTSTYLHRPAWFFCRRGFRGLCSRGKPAALIPDAVDSGPLCTPRKPVSSEPRVEQPQHISARSTTSPTADIA